MSNEFFYRDENGKKQDAALHNAILRTPINETIMGPIRSRYRQEYLNERRKRVRDDFNEEQHPRHPKGSPKGGEFAKKGAAAFAATLLRGNVPHVVMPPDPGSGMQGVKVPKQEDLSSLEGSAMTTEGYMHKAEGIGHNYYMFKSPDGQVPHHAMLHMNEMEKISGKKGSNEGGVYKENSTGMKFYIKSPKTADHVQNELMAAKLYQLAGAKTMNYVPVAGGMHVATELATLEKDNISQFNADERHEAQKDFGIHAWLANWDAAGTGGDNQVVYNGHTRTVDVGGSLKYRAQGTPKGEAFGNEVTETKTLVDHSKNPDAANLYGNMTDAQKYEAYKRVTDIPDTEIWKTVNASGTNMDLAAKLIARKKDLLKQQNELATKLNNELSADPFAYKPPMFKANEPTTTPALIPHPDPTSKMGIIHGLLTKEGGTTKEELLQGTGWVNIGIPKMASNLNLNLEKNKVGNKTIYKGTQMTPEQIETKAKAEKEAKKNTGAKSEEEPKPAPKTVMGPSTAAPKPAAPVITPPPPATTSGPYKVGEPFITVAGFDINKPTGAFKQSLHEHSVEYQKSEGQLYEHYSPNSDNDKSMMAQIAKYHPAAIDNGDGSFSIKKESVQAPGTTQAEVAAQKDPIEKFEAVFNPSPLKHEAFKQELNKLGVLTGALKEDPDDPTQYKMAVSAGMKTTAANIAKNHPEWTLKPNHDATYVALKSSFNATTAPPTEAELTKAKKNTKLTAQYVPGAPAGHPGAEALITEFNKKYEGKVITDPAELATKVNEFKQLAENMKPFMSEQQKAQAAAQAANAVKQAEAAAKAQAVAAAEKAAFEASLNDPAVKAQYEKLNSIGISNPKSLEQQHASKIKKLAAMGHTINGADAAYISAYVGSAYEDLNADLWRGDKMQLKQSIYAAAFGKALDKMPSYAGSAVRGVKSPKGAFERYANAVGGTVTELGFSSYGATHKLWGSEATIYLTATDLKDIRTFNSGEGGGELILQRGAILHITKVDKKTREVWATQIA